MESKSSEFKGNEFLRNVEIEKERVELQKKVDKLESEKTNTIIKPHATYDIPAPSFDEQEPAVVVDIPDNRKSDFSEEINIKLNNPLSNSTTDDTKKKYIILSIALVILFILTVVIIGLISDDKQEKDLFITPTIEQIKQDKILETPNSDEKYQALIDEKANKTIDKELNLKKIAKEEIPLPKVTKQTIVQKKAKENDVFGMEIKEKATAKAKVTPKKVVKEATKVVAKEIMPKKIVPKKEIVKKEIVKKAIVKKVIPAPKIVQKPKVIQKQKIIQKPKVIKSTTMPKQIATYPLKGNYIQVGAFTKLPNITLINQIKKAGYTHVIHKMTINNVVYNKVLIGSYKTEQSTEALEKIRKNLNKPNAYILRLK